MADKVAMITGATGQDGAYLAELLLDKGYIVHGVKRRSSSFNTERVDHLYHDLHESGRPYRLHYGDLTDATNLIRLVQEIQPTELYNLGAQSHVLVSFETPEYSANADALGTLRRCRKQRLACRGQLVGVVCLAIERPLGLRREDFIDARTQVQLLLARETDAVEAERLVERLAAGGMGTQKGHGVDIDRPS
jgi:hypothetical protein